MIIVLTNIQIAIYRLPGESPAYSRLFEAVDPECKMESFRHWSPGNWGEAVFKPLPGKEKAALLWLRANLPQDTPLTVINEQ